MTDSMKFGPEWLRNMSGDSTNAVSGSSSGSSSLNNNASINSADKQTNPNIANHAQAPRSLFPEFRYGREEMLSLFDKNCILPEILPTYKKLFVDKVQYPLALTPSTDEEITQSTAISSQRPAWMQRSPVGFSSSTRGTGRGAAIERGRMRGKSNYHTIYQRPNAMFDDDLRVGALKPERGWSERNGAGDALGAPGNVNVGIDWNGTPASSPRKEFSSHSRNLENWRRNRNEDGSGDTTTSVLTSNEGWRGTGSSSFSSNHRWGRSTSWRDEEISTPSTETGYGGIGTPIQRSFSTIAAPVSDRGGFNNHNTVKSPNQGIASQLNRANITANSANTQMARNTQWTNVGKGTFGADGDDNLPEWATENPSNGGGTFDATGAFHGLVDKEDGTPIAPERKDSVSRSKPVAQNTEGNDEGNDESNVNNIGSINPANVAKESQKQSEINNSITVLENINTHSEKPHEDYTKFQADKMEDNKKVSTPESDSDIKFEPVSKTRQSSSSTYYHTAENPHFKMAQPDANDSPHIDFSDRMKEVADDMVEKLIMDDDAIAVTGGENCNESPTEAPTVNSGIIGAQNVFVPPPVSVLLKKNMLQTTQNEVPVSPTLSAISRNPIEKPVYNSGVAVDQASMHHHLHSQTINLNATANSTPSELWFYTDPQSKIQGPFTAMEMTEWYRAGYFNENLFVRRGCDTRFRTLGELIKHCHGNMPFTHSHFLPISLDDIHLTNSTAIPHIREKTQMNERDDLKCSVTAAADSLSTAVKNLISSVDISHMLNMHFQVLQEQYMRHQEMLIHAELSKTERFQHLSPQEREAVVRQKVQMLVLPDYLTSLTGLTNSLATLNPAAGMQLYDAIAEYSKKDQMFSGAAQPASPMNTFLNANDYIINAQQQQQPAQAQFVPVLPTATETNSKMGPMVEDLARSELLNEFNLRMLMRNESLNPNQLLPQKSNSFLNTANATDFLTDQHLLNASGSQSPMMQMWMPQLNIAPNAVQPQIIPQHLHHQSNHWAGGLLVGMSNAPIAGSQITLNNVGETSRLGSTIWDTSALEPPVNQQKFEERMASEDKQEELHHAKERHAQLHLKHMCVEEENTTEVKLQTQGQLQIDVASNLTAPTNIMKYQKDDIENVHLGNKRLNGKQQLAVPASKSKEDNGVAAKKHEEERRRESVEEKRRQKEEKRRQQVEEEKRRLQQLEEEKRRQSLEEKERQQQIQAQRRKAMLGTMAGVSQNSSTTTGISPSSSSKQSKDQRLQSSVAPWSTQITAAANKAGPCLAEIQKAERRERRADQLRQMELLEKQIRANAATAEANDLMLKWNASPLPVRSFAEIQAEEAKRLAEEQLELQRRKEQENQSLLTTSNTAAANAMGAGNVSNISNIWGGNKVWGATSTGGFWEDPVKFNVPTSTNNPSPSIAAIIGSNLNYNTARQSPQTQSKGNNSGNQQTPANARNIKKSQTVPVMQNAMSPLQKSTAKANNTVQNNASVTVKTNKTQSKEVDKKTTAKSSSQSAAIIATSATSKRDEFENEFTSWCTKSLNNMHTKVDVPTFVTFLQDLESPYEVKDYIRMYLGEGKEYMDFAKQFLERRSKYKNLQRAQNAHNDDMCKPAPAITPSGNDNFDNKGKQKKFKKKMTKMDARILGFSVTAAEGRINVGDRDYVDAP